MTTISSTSKGEGAIRTNVLQRALDRWLRTARQWGAVKRVFICYRRDGKGAGYALNLYDRLTAVLGVGHVFVDVAGDAIKAGANWQAAVQSAIERSTVVLAIIDRGWAERLHTANDAVRFELTRAVSNARPIAIFPVRVDDAPMPSQEELPSEIASLSLSNAFHVRPATADADLLLIVKTLTGRSTPLPTIAPDRYDAGIAHGVQLPG